MSIKSSWDKLHKELKALGENAGVDLPLAAMYGPGDEYRRLTQRIEAVADFLRKINAALKKGAAEPKKPAAKKTTAKTEADA